MGIKLDGAACAAEIRELIKSTIAVSGRKDIYLTIFQVGNDDASNRYIKWKLKDCEEVGIRARVKRYPENDDGLTWLFMDVTNYGDGAQMVQRPLPRGDGWERCGDRFYGQDDVDGLARENRIALYLNESPDMLPPTAMGMMYLLSKYRIPIEGARVAVVGRGWLVGRPMAALMERAGATVCVAHSHTKDLGEVCRWADIIVTGTGKPDLITPDMIKEGAVLLDGDNIMGEDGKLHGGFHPDCYPKSGYYTPAVGGVGPMTRAMLLVNTCEANGLSIRVDWEE